MKKIRKGVFETNSSSSHSISIAGGKLKLDRLPVEDGICEIFEGKFGWGPERFDGSTDKASYCLTHAKSDEDKLAMLKKVIQSEMGVPVIFRKGDGYIDHQSYEACEEAFESEDKLKRFIFDERSSLDIDNDNH